MARYIQKAVGYILTGLTSQQCLFVLYGSGANGKSVFIRILGALLGEYAKTIQPESLMVRNSSSNATPDLAQLHGARLVVAPEPRDGATLEESLVKRLTGEDKIACRELYKNPFEFIPAFKIILPTNHKPKIRGTDHAIWRRIRLVPFGVIVPEESRDIHLIGKLEGELPGILNWALEGLRLYWEEGLHPPKAVEEATKSYRSDMDFVAQWIDDECIRVDGANTPLTDLFASYRRWCVANECPALSRRKLADELVRQGFPRSRTGTARGHGGIKLKGTVNE